MYLVRLHRPGVVKNGAALAVVVLVQKKAAVQSALLHRAAALTCTKVGSIL